MANITRAHIIAARARRDLLTSRKKPVPPKIAKLAALDPMKFPRSRTVVQAHGKHSTTPADGHWVVQVDGVSHSFEGRVDAVEVGRAAASRPSEAQSSGNW